TNYSSKSVRDFQQINHSCADSYLHRGVLCTLCTRRNSQDSKPYRLNCLRLRAWVLLRSLFQSVVGRHRWVRWALKFCSDRWLSTWTNPSLHCLSYVLVVFSFWFFGTQTWSSAWSRCSRHRRCRAEWRLQSTAAGGFADQPYAAQYCNKDH